MDMLDAFLMFVAGAAAMRLLQILLAINPNYYIFKEAETVSLYILMELHIQRLTALKILELTYEECGRFEEYANVKRAIDEKYNILITKSISNLKNRLPYKVEYTTLQEAAEYYRTNAKEKRDD